MTDRRTPSDDKSSHGLWLCELKRNKIVLKIKKTAKILNQKSRFYSEKHNTLYETKIENHNVHVSN